MHSHDFVTFPYRSLEIRTNLLEFIRLSEMTRNENPHPAYARDFLVPKHPDQLDGFKSRLVTTGSGRFAARLFRAIVLPSLSSFSAGFSFILRYPPEDHFRNCLAANQPEGL